MGTMSAPTIRNAPSAPASSQPAAAQSNAVAQQAQAPIPFTRASRQKSFLPFTISNVTLTAAQQTIGPIEIAPAGYIRYIELQVTATTSGNAATVAFAADAPWNLIQGMFVYNSAGDTIQVPLDGYTVYVQNKYGCLSQNPPNNDPKKDPNYGSGPVTGAGGNGGSFVFVVRIPWEIDARDALCALPNMAANKSYQLGFTLNASTAIYTTPPTSQPVISIAAVVHYWHAPDQANANGYPQQTAPRGNGSLSMWRTQQPTVNAGTDQYIQLLNVGNVLRCVFFILRNGSGVRDSVDWPALVQIVLNNDVMFYEPAGLLKRDIVQAYGLDGSLALDSKNGLDTGVFPLPYTLWDGADGVGVAAAGNNRDHWLPTLDTTLLQLHASSWGGSAGQLNILTNEIKPASSQAIYSPFFI